MSVVHHPKSYGMTVIQVHDRDGLGDGIDWPGVFAERRRMLQLVLGSELAENLLFTGQRVLPRVLLGDDTFTFQQPDLETALRALLRS